MAARPLPPPPLKSTEASGGHCVKCLGAFDLPIRPFVAIPEWPFYDAEWNGLGRSILNGWNCLHVVLFGNSEAIPDLRKDKSNAPFAARHATVNNDTNYENTRAPASLHNSLTCLFRTCQSSTMYTRVYTPAPNLLPDLGCPGWRRREFFSGGILFCRSVGLSTWNGDSGPTSCGSVNLASPAFEKRGHQSEQFGQSVVIQTAKFCQ